MKFLRSLLVISSFVFFLASCGPDPDPVKPKATHLYFSDFTGKRVGVVDLNNLNTATTLVDENDGLDTVTGIAVDFVGGKIYAAEEMNDRVVRFNLDGSGTVQALYEWEDDSVMEPTAVAFDAENNVLYWANSGTGRLMKGAMDGSTDATVMFDSAKALNYSYGLIYEPKSKSLVYSDFGADASIRVAPVERDSTYIVKLFYPGFALRSPSQIAVFPDQGRIYWADEELGTLATGALSNSAASIIYDDEDGIERADGIAIDFGSQKIYWTDTITKKIMRANLDGTGDPEVVLENVESYSIILKFDNQ